MSKKNKGLDKKSYEKGVLDTIKALVKFCHSQEQFCEKDMKAFLKQKRYTELLEQSIQQDVYWQIADGLACGYIELDLPLLDELKDE